MKTPLSFSCSTLNKVDSFQQTPAHSSSSYPITDNVTAYDLLSQKEGIILLPVLNISFLISLFSLFHLFLFSIPVTLPRLSVPCQPPSKQLWLTESEVKIVTLIAMVKKTKVNKFTISHFQHLHFAHPIIMALSFRVTTGDLVV